MCASRHILVWFDVHMHNSLVACGIFIYGMVIRTYALLKILIRTCTHVVFDEIVFLRE